MSPDPVEIQSIIEPWLARLFRKYADKLFATTLATTLITRFGWSPAEAIPVAAGLSVPVSYGISWVVDRVLHKLGWGKVVKG